jgi:hypothetical protein
MKTLQIEITKEDVENAKAELERDKNNWSICRSCIGHQALRRYLTTDQFVFNGSEAYIGLGLTVVKASKELDKAIMDYGWRDTMDKFPLGTYTIEVDEQYLKEEYK